MRTRIGMSFKKTNEQLERKAMKNLGDGWHAEIDAENHNEILTYKDPDDKVTAIDIIDDNTPKGKYTEANLNKLNKTQLKEIVVEELYLTYPSDITKRQLISLILQYQESILKGNI